MKGQTVLVTGISGTFGSAFARYALSCGAVRVIGLSRGEHRQAELERAINDPRLECWLKDVTDREDMHWVMRAKPDVVIHAAAVKRIEKCEQNPRFAHKVNVDGTRIVCEESMLAGVPKVLVVSSDKASSPETAYGKMKAAAEEVAIGQNAYRGNGPTRISVVRWGNVLGSQGSFLEVLHRCRETGDPVPITDQRATRFWWRIEDAVAFVDRMLCIMEGGEIFIPKIESAPVVELAHLVAPRSEVRIVGMRGPEKLHECMINATESSYAYETSAREFFVLLPKQREWWSAKARPWWAHAPDGFAYTSDQAVNIEALEALTCASR